MLLHGVYLRRGVNRCKSAHTTALANPPPLTDTGSTERRVRLELGPARGRDHRKSESNSLLNYIVKKGTLVAKLLCTFAAFQ